MSKRSQIIASKRVSSPSDICQPSAADTAPGSESCAVAIDPIPHVDGFVTVGGYVFYENWDEIDPPGRDDDEPEIPHEEVMAKIRALLKKPIESLR